MIVRMLALVAGLLAGAAASQFPEFVQQYTQRLGGAVDELRAFVVAFDNDAAAAGLTRTEALAEYQTVTTEFLMAQGARAEERIDRYERLSAGQAALEAAGPFQRALVFARDHDNAIARNTLAAFRPAVPVTPEGFVYAGAGFVLGAAALAAIASLLGALLRPRRGLGARA